MYQSTRAYPNPLQSIASSAVTGTYQAIGTKSLYPGRILRIVNNSSQDITISWDGSTDHDYIKTQTSVTYDFGAMKGTSAPACEMDQGAVLFVKGTAGTGNIYVVIISAISPTN